MFRTLKSLMFSSLLMIFLLAACSGNDSNQTQQPNNTTPPSQTTPADDPSKNTPPPAPPEPVELVFYSTAGDHDEAAFMRIFGEPIKKAFPHVTPKFIPYGTDTTLDKLITSGQVVDILYNSIGQTAQTLLQYDMQYDISTLIKQNNYDLNRLEPTTVEVQRQLADGGIYGLPLYNNALTTFYNRDLFDKFGVDFPSDGMTWPDIYDLAARMSRTADGVRYHGLILSMSHNMMLNSLSTPYVDQQMNKPLFDTEAFTRAFKTFTDVYNIPGNEVDNTTRTYGNQLALYEKEKVVSMFLGLSQLAAVRFAPMEDFNWDVVTYPTYPEAPDVGPQPYPSYTYISKASNHKEAAFPVIAYLTSDEFQNSMARHGQIPILKNAEFMDLYGADIPALAGRNIKSLVPTKFAAPAFKGIYQTIANSEVTNAYYAVILGQKDINTAMRDANEVIAQKIAEAQAQSK